MRISEKKSQALFDAISDSIMDLRIELKQDNSINIEEKLFKLQFTISNKVDEALNIKE